MRQLSIEEKAKAFDEALKYGRYLIDTRCKEGSDGFFHRSDLHKMFPGIEENEEQVAQKLYKLLCAEVTCEQFEKHGLTVDSALYWLEKQIIANSVQTCKDEQKPVENNYPKYNKGDILTDGKSTYKVLSWDYTESGIAAYYMEGNGCKFSWGCEEADKKLKPLEQNPADKVEPKFKVGDWIVYNRDNYSREITQVYDIRDGRYYFTDNVHFSWSIKECDEKSHLWTIQDAKRGDILSYDKSKCIAMFLKIENVSFKDICFTGAIDGKFHIGGWHDIEKAHPATKEQRDLLFQKMKEAGYEWDAEKKELKRIVTPIFHIGDRVIYKEHKCDGVITEITDTDYICGKFKLPISTQDELELVKQKPAWSEEDEAMLYFAIRAVRLCRQYAINHQVNGYSKLPDIPKRYEKLQDWLKSLRPQNTWKPSDEQLHYLSWIANIKLGDSVVEQEVSKHLNELLEDLKKLKG